MNICDKLNITVSRKSDHKLLPFLACCIMNRNIIKDLPYLFNEFAPDEEKDIAIIHSQINLFFLFIVKLVNKHYVFPLLLSNLPRMKPE